MGWGGRQAKQVEGTGSGEPTGRMQPRENSKGTDDRKPRRGTGRLGGCIEDVDANRRLEKAHRIIYPSTGGFLHIVR